MGPDELPYAPVGDYEFMPVRSPAPVRPRHQPRDLTISGGARRRRWWARLWRRLLGPPR